MATLWKPTCLLSGVDTFYKDDHDHDMTNEFRHIINLIGPENVKVDIVFISYEHCHGVSDHSLLISESLKSYPMSQSIVKYLACFNGKFMGARGPHENFRDETVMV